MATSARLGRANLIALLLPALLLGGALASQYVGHLVPCEMCVWQRWPHLAAIILALAGLAARRQPRVQRLFIMLAAAAILTSGVIGAFHAGVEYHWWAGITRCTSFAAHGPGRDVLKDILAAPLVRCDVAQWTLAGISLAGWNALLSIGGYVVIVLLCIRFTR